MDEEEDSRFQLGTSMQKTDKLHGNVLDELYNEPTENLILKPSYGGGTNPGSYQVKNRLLTTASEIHVDIKKTEVESFD